MPNLANSINNIQFAQMERQIFTASGTYTPTAGMIYCYVEVVGGGGGGGGAAGTSSSQQANGGGGGGGGYASALLSAATAGASQSIVIGNGGAAGNGTTIVNGGNGGTTSFGSLVEAGGGLGGSTGAASSNFNASEFGAGGVGITGTLQIPGESGTSGISTFDVVGSTTNSVNLGGAGGGTIYSPGAAQGYGSHVTGFTGSVYGGGGGGASNVNTQSAVNGGAGASGVCIITEYIA